MAALLPQAGSKVLHWATRMIPNVRVFLPTPFGGRVYFRARTHKWLWRGVAGLKNERLIFAWYREHVSKGAVFFDVGANVGAHTVALAHLVGPKGRVVAFEPDPDNLDLLRHSVEANRLGNVEIVPCAVSKSSGRERFWRDTSSGATGTLAPRGENSWYHATRGLAPAVVEVATTTLDDYVARSGIYPDVVKIDVEGAEGEVLEGMTAVLSSRRPELVIDGAVPRAFELLRRQGYRLFDPALGGAEIRTGAPRGAFMASPDRGSPSTAGAGTTRA